MIVWLGLIISNDKAESNVSQAGGCIWPFIAVSFTVSQSKAALSGGRKGWNFEMAQFLVLWQASDEGPRWSRAGEMTT